MKYILTVTLAGMLLVWCMRSYSQENNARVLTMQDAFDLAVKNSTQLKVSEIKTAFAHQRVEIAKLGKLPEITSGRTMVI